MLISKLVTPRSVFVLLEGHPPLQTNSDHPNYQRIIEALNNEDFEALPSLFSKVNAVRDFGAGHWDVTDEGEVIIDGEVVCGTIVGRILDAIDNDNGNDPESFVRFQRALSRNPSYRIREQLFDFIDNSKSIGITPDGHLVAFKIVRRTNAGQLVSIYDGRTAHNVGDVVTMDRSEVDDNPERTCSAGLHACSENYLSHYGSGGDVVIAVKIDPADVVSIPTDYNNAKMRCCKYTVAAELGKVSDILVNVPDLNAMSF